MRRDGMFIIGLALLTVTSTVSAGAQSAPTSRSRSMTEARAMTQTSTPIRTGYAKVNGLRMYYELHGTEGFPLVLRIHQGRLSFHLAWCQFVLWKTGHLLTPLSNFTTANPFLF